MIKILQAFNNFSITVFSNFSVTHWDFYLSWSIFKSKNDFIYYSSRRQVSITMLRVAEAENQKERKKQRTKTFWLLTFQCSFIILIVSLSLNEETEGIHIHVSRLTSQPFPCKKKLFPHHAKGIRLTEWL
jgi:hypothetical protein